MRQTSVQYKKFRGLVDYHFAVDDFNVPVGPTNSGKSTVVSALRSLASGIQIARSKAPVTEPGAVGAEIAASR